MWMRFIGLEYTTQILLASKVQMVLLCGIASLYMKPVNSSIFLLSLEPQNENTKILFKIYQVFIRYSIAVLGKEHNEIYHCINLDTPENHP